MKIDLYFKTYNLGTLSFVGSEYIFIQNQAEIDKFKKVYPFDFFEFKQKITKSTTLFDTFKEFVDDIKKRDDLLEKANIKPDDEDFVLLYKYAGLNQYEEKFYLRRNK